MPFNKSGPLSEDELFELWLSVVDQEGYAQPLLTQPNSGIELIKQTPAQLGASSLAVDQTFQSLYILPWSGQSNLPASGGARALVRLEITRTNQSVLAANVPLVFQAGLYFDHSPVDYSNDGPLQVLTGRRYLSQQYQVLGPGELGPVVIDALSEGMAAGYNLPLPNTITVLEQPGNTFLNDEASVYVTGSNSRLVLHDRPEVLTPSQLGQYVLFTGGTNAGKIARMVGYESATLGNGGVAILANEGMLRVTGVSGSFVLNEPLTFTSPAGLLGTLLWMNGSTMLVGGAGAGAVTGTVTGAISGATATVASNDGSSVLVSEVGTAAWRVLDWAIDLGIQVTNPASPTGGLTPTLDALGNERKILRSYGETDDVYRERVASPADVVSPNAIIRAMNRVLVPAGVHGCFREVGRALFRGFFYDGDPTSIDPDIAFAYDMDFTTRPADRYKLYLDYTEFRAFFIITVPPIPGLNESGFAYDDHPTGFYDATPFNDFYDGFPLQQGDLYRQLWNAIANVVAGGVGFDIVLDGGPCT